MCVFIIVVLGYGRDSRVKLQIPRIAVLAHERTAGAYTACSVRAHGRGKATPGGRGSFLIVVRRLQRNGCFAYKGTAAGYPLRQEPFRLDSSRSIGVVGLVFQSALSSGAH